MKRLVSVGVLAMFAAMLGPGSAWAGEPSLDSCDAGIEVDADVRESWGCYYDAARAGADWEAAEQRLRAAMDAHPGEPGHAYALAVLANLVSPKRPEEGIALYEQAFGIFAERGDDLALTLTALNLGHRYRVAGQPDRAAAILVDAEAAAERHNDPRWIATVKSERVRHMLRTGGDLHQALRLLAETEPLLFPDGDYQARIIWLNSAGMVNDGLGRVTRAEVYFDRLIAATQAQGDAYAEANARYNRVLRALGRGATKDVDPTMLRELEQIEAVARAGENTPIEISAKCARGDLIRSEAVVRECLEQAHAFGDGRIIADALIGLAWLLAEDSSPSVSREAEVFGLIDEAIARARASEDAFQLVRTLSRKAELRWWFGPEALARAESEAAIAELEALRAQHRDPEGRAEVKGTWTDVYKRTVGHLLGGSRARGRTVEPSADELAAAFEVSERMRAQVLLESLADAGVERGLERVDPSYGEVLRELATVQIRLSDPELSARDRAVLLSELESLERREQALLASEGSSSSSATTVSLAEVSAGLEPDEALLVYQLGDTGERAEDWDGGAWVMVVTRDRMTAHRLVDRRELQSRLELFGPLLARRDGGEAEAASRLWSALLGEALAELPEPVDRLIIVADGALHRLPFAALRPDAGAETLAERYAITFAPSATSLTHWRRAHKPDPGVTKVLALADPLLRDQPARLYASVLAPERGASLVEGLRLAPLPRAREEAELAAAAGGEAWLGEHAGEHALRSHDLAPYGVIHFATHALVDELHPGRSAIVLSRDAEQHDGFLQPREIVDLPLEGKLVVLSACSSASGAVIDGEGVMGLAHALFQAGAHAVVGSLWPIRDDDALALFERFYVHLDAGLPVAEALAAAQRDRQAEGAPPAAWAGVVVLGEGSLVVRTERPQAEPAERARRWPAVLLAIMAALAGLLVLARRRV